MKTILCTMLDNNFIPGFECFIKSLLKNNSWFDLPIRIIDVGISTENKEKCQNIYSKIEFVLPKKENYTKISFEKTLPILHNTYYKLDIFSYDDVDRLIFIDMDILVLDDIKQLFEYSYPIAGCRGYANSSDALRKDINTGVIVLNKPLLNKQIYKEILSYTEKAGGFSMPDQKAINQFFGKKINILPKNYNCEKRLWTGKKNKVYFNEGVLYYKEGEKKLLVKMLHYVSQKPFDKNPRDKNNIGYEQLEKLWWSIYNE